MFKNRMIKLNIIKLKAQTTELALAKANKN